MKITCEGVMVKEAKGSVPQDSEIETQKQVAVDTKRSTLTCIGCSPAAITLLWQARILRKGRDHGVRWNEQVR